MDDHSSDPTTLELLDGWRQVGSRIRVVRNTAAEAPALARNLGIHEASGE